MKSLSKRELPTNVQQLLSIKKYEETSKSSKDSAVPLPPPYKPKLLEDSVTGNSSLGQCVAAYITNIESTGHSFQPKAYVTENVDQLLLDAEDFFSEPYPGMTFTSMREKVRRDYEVFGYSGMSVIRNSSEEIVMLKPLEAKFLRIGSKDVVSETTRSIRRNGSDIDMTFTKRFKSYASVEFKQTEYFREFGAPDLLDKNTGLWANTTPAESAQEIIWFEQSLFKKNGYPVPRWINQTKSIVGSDKAEILNTEYLFNDGIPPAIVFLLNGEAQKTDGVASLLDGSASNRIAVIEIAEASGSIDSTSKVGVQVERFGAEMLKDSMFSDYLDKAKRNIRSAFRLPALFLGDSQDHTYNNALTSYKTTEIQVFSAERKAFDSIINSTIMKELFPGIEFMSNALILSDIESMLKGLELSKDVTDNFVDEINNVTGLSLEAKDPESDEDLIAKFIKNDDPKHTCCGDKE